MWFETRTGTAQWSGGPAHTSIEPVWTRPLRLVLRVEATHAVRSAARRLMPRSSPVAARLSAITDTFVTGYCAALAATTTEEIATRLAAIDVQDRGFGYEGAAMALTLLDSLSGGRRRRFAEFVRGPAASHVYMAHVGAGWAAARLRRPPDAVRRGLDPLLGWLAVDGYGFHQGYFHSRIYVARRVTPRWASGYTIRVFDQGLGRSLWFVDGADVDRIADTISTFPTVRRADLWSGVALAAAYAGGVSAQHLRTLKQHAAGYEAHLAQGVAFAAEARYRAGNPAPHTDSACAILGGVSAPEASHLVRQLAATASDVRDVPAYEDWRRRVGHALVVHASAGGSGAPIPFSPIGE